MSHMTEVLKSLSTSRPGALALGGGGGEEEDKWQAFASEEEKEERTENSKGK